MPHPTRRALVAGTGALAAASLAPSSLLRAQPAIPETAKILVGFPPGGTTDVTSRRVAERLRGVYARTVVVDNKPGAGGRVAIDLMRAEKPDSGTLLLTPASMLIIYPHIYRQLSYNPFEDLVPVSTACYINHGIGVGPAVPETVRTVNDFVGWCRANPGRANYGSPAAGSIPHFLAAQLEIATKVQLNHIAFRGSQLAILDMLGGQISAVSCPVGEFLPHMKTGRVRVLATSGQTRNRFFPDVPTYTEQGFPQIVAREWFAFLAPKGTPADAVRRAQGMIRDALAAPEVIDGLAQMGLEAGASTPEELTRLIRADHDRWGPIVKSIGFTADS